LASFGDALDRLAAFYGPLRMPPDDPFGYFVWEVLGTRTTAGRRDAALAALRRVPALTPDGLKKLARGRLEAIVRLCGALADERLAALDAGVRVFERQPRIVQRLRGPLRAAWPAARDLPHVGHAGAVALLLFAGASRTVPVDEGLARVATRLGLVEPTANRRRLLRGARRALDAVLPSASADRRRAVLYFRHHAEHACAPVNPHCGVCPLRSGCPEGMRHAAD
jgi:endonuclease III